MIVVLDSNVWTSAFLSPRGVPGRLLTLVRMGLLDVVSSSRLWGELERAVHYNRVRELLERAGLWDDTTVFLRDRPCVAFVVATEPVSNWLAQDPDDDWVIQCALTARADRIVSGDKALRALGAIGVVQIVTPRELPTELEVLGIVVG